MRRFGMAVLAVTVLSACSDAFTPEGVSGFYELKTVNGEQLPFSQTVFGVTVEFTAGSVTLSQNGTFSSSGTVTVSDATTSVTETETESGTFVLVEPNTVRFTASDGDVSSGTLVGGRLTFTDEGNTFIFEKQ